MGHSLACFDIGYCFSINVQFRFKSNSCNLQVIGICEVDLENAKFIQKPKHRVAMDLDFINPPALTKMKRLVEKKSKDAKKEQQKKAPEVEQVGVDEHGRKQFKLPEGPAPTEARLEAAEKKVLPSWAKTCREH